MDSGEAVLNFPNSRLLKSFVDCVSHVLGVPGPIGMLGLPVKRFISLWSVPFLSLLEFKSNE